MVYESIDNSLSLCANGKCWVYSEDKGSKAYANTIQWWYFYLLHIIYSKVFVKVKCWTLNINSINISCKLYIITLNLF